MEEIVATIFLRRLNSRLCEESEIFGGLEDEILLLKSQLSHLNSHIQPFHSELVQIGYFNAMSNIISIELKESIHNWLVMFKETIHDADDCINLFIIRMKNNSKDGLNDSDRIVAAALLGCELRIINECLVEILGVKSQLDTSIASLSIEHSSIIDDEGENSFINKFITLSMDLKSCFMYSCFYIERWGTYKYDLVQLLMAEGNIVEEIPGGERMEDIVEGNINKLIELGMVQVENEYLPDSLLCSVPKPYHHCVAEGDAYLYIKDIRHLRIYDKETVVNLENIHISSIRSLFISNLLEMKLFNWKLLRVLRLHFKGSKSIIIEEVGNLINLRYLKLWFPELEKLPESIGNLRNLQTLDIDCPSLKEVPSGIPNLLQLRHLKINRDSIRQKRTLNDLYVGDGIASELEMHPEIIGNLRNLQTLAIDCPSFKEVASELLNLLQLRYLKINRDSIWQKRTLGLRGIGQLTKLQTLSDLYVGDGIASELSNLTQIRQLGIVDLGEEDASELYASIMKMTGLLSLSLSATAWNDYCYSKEELLPSLEPFSPPPLLQKLRLVGCLQEMPDCFSSMKNLTHLVLMSSNLLENPTSVLESLPNLKFLEFNEAFEARYIGREFCRSGGFPCLETLIIESESLIEWTELEQGSFPSLKFLYFYCWSLRTLPEGLQLITTLQKLKMPYCHGELARKLSPDGGPENYKIKHIPRIEFSWAMAGEW